MRKYVTTTSDKEKTTALLLCIFGGIFGLHHFYVGKIGSGFLYLFTGGIFMFGWIFDIGMISIGQFTDSAGLALRQ